MGHKQSVWTPKGLRKVCWWPDVVYTSVNIKKIIFIPYIYII